MKKDNKVTVWWIDDDHADANGPRNRERNKLEAEVENSLELVPIHPAEFDDRVKHLSNESVPDLLLIDFRLNNKQHATKETPFYARDGVSLRGITLGINELRDIPAYLVSMVTRNSQTGNSDDRFDWILSHEQLVNGSGGALLWEDATAYKSLRKLDVAVLRPKKIDKFLSTIVPAICEQLRVPNTSLDTLQDLVTQTVRIIIKKEMTLNSTDIKLVPSRLLTIARWVRSTLHRVRGPLIDDLGVATLLGTKLNYFRNVLKPRLSLNEVTYSGIFCTTATLTVWRQAFLQWLVSKHETIQMSSLPTLAESSVKYFNVPDTERSTCRVCNQLWPEAIAADEDDPSVEAAVHWRCTKEATDLDSVLGFDVPRYFQ